MRKTFALVALLAAAVFVVPASQAITDGEVDGNNHPHVGLMIAEDANGVPMWRCSGTLLSPTVFLTAGHCVEAPAANIEIWFLSGSPNQIGAADGYPTNGQVSGTPQVDPNFDFPFRDVGVVLLDAPWNTPGNVYGTLPTLNQLDSLKTKRGQQDVWFTAVGYGLQKSFPTPADFQESRLRTRMVAYPKLNQINVPGFVGDFSMLLSNNANTGGTCFGDSGGPNFLGSSNVVAGVTSYGINGNCAGTGGVFRMDRQWALDFVTPFLAP
ncbi:MAG TPA: trypsin-like serine protease [Gaiellaceae bacterium]|nr:trypsin-like serine protease [Gaiellaceae bacterium]